MDGLVDMQEIFGRITYVDEYRAEYEVEGRVREENILMRVASVGFSRALAPEDLARISGFILL